MRAKHIATRVGLAVLIGLALLIPQLSGNASDSEVEAFQVEQVWVFQHSSANSDDALHAGMAEIVEDCLLVDGAVVIWQTDQIDQAAEAIEAVHRGETPTLAIAGGGVSVTEGGLEIPAVVGDRCDVSEVWFAAS